MSDFNQQVIDEFRANGGNVGGNFATMPLLLLHHVGARSGSARVAPVVYLADGDRWIVFASKAGAPTHPAWYHNLVANPDTQIEVGPDTVAVRAIDVQGAERDELYARQVAVHPRFGEYEVQAGGRTIPVIALERR